MGEDKLVQPEWEGWGRHQLLQLNVHYYHCWHLQLLLFQLLGQRQVHVVQQLRQLLGQGQVV